MTRALIVPVLAANGVLVHIGEFTTLEASVLGLCTAVLILQLWRKPAADDTQNPLFEMKKDWNQ